MRRRWRCQLQCRSSATLRPACQIPRCRACCQVLKGWVGGEKGFDPLGVTDALPVYWTREAELKHGRVAWCLRCFCLRL